MLAVSEFRALQAQIRSGAYDSDELEYLRHKHPELFGEGNEVIRIDLIDRAGTRYEFGWVYPARLWPTVEDEIMAGARAEAAKMHGAVQAYYEDDPERGLPE